VLGLGAQNRDWTWRECERELRGKAEDWTEEGELRGKVENYCLGRCVEQCADRGRIVRRNGGLNRGKQCDVMWVFPQPYPSSYVKNKNCAYVYTVLRRVFANPFHTLLKHDFKSSPFTAVTLSFLYSNSSSTTVKCDHMCVTWIQKKTSSVNRFKTLEHTDVLLEVIRNLYPQIKNL
jgi:hypothetical protein